ncbi:pre-rrna-processing protein ipi3 [Moniliophthora roreri]|uniref:Pre-rRNA-processing protein IPI3 n=1 Tax=Moniliophthora roreri TaxID=221103 RepID=A0A0W0G4B2_MONRR|nr:pre-rrna-processing protein ipi3 [Moniliophthora roreri]
MPLQETILCATASASTSAGSGSISLHDFKNGASLVSFKQTNSGRHCTSYIESKNAQGGILLAAQPDKSLLHVYNFQKDQISMKIVLPEKLSCIVLDSQGIYFAGGTAQGRVASGILYNSWDAHYRQVNVLRFTQDSAALISGSDDSGVSVWSVSRLVDEDLQNDLPLSLFNLSDHTLPVTDIVCGVGAFPKCRILTASVDHSVKIWDLSSRTLLTTFMFPQAISSLAWDITERLFFAASADGSVYQVNLFKQREDKTKSHISEAIGGGGVSDVIRVSDERLIVVGQPVTCLTFSMTSSSLLVGTSTGLIHIYDVPTHQLMRTISTHKGFGITYLSTMLKPVDLIGHISLTLNISSSNDTRDVIPVRPVAAFQRMRDVKSRELHEVSMLLPPQEHAFEDEFTLCSEESILRDQAYFLKSSTSSDEDTAALQTRVTDLEAEVSLLHEQLGRAKGVNDLMWENVVQKMISQSKSKSVTGSGEDERARKRSRS